MTKTDKLCERISELYREGYTTEEIIELFCSNDDRVQSIVKE